MKHGMEIAVAAIIIIFAGVFLFRTLPAINPGSADGEAAELTESSGYEPWIEPALGVAERRDESLLLPCRPPSAP